MPRQSERQRQFPLADPLCRRLRLEALEDRRLLASVTVSNNLDLVNGDTSLIANLIADDGGDGISLRESILAANATSGADEIIFAAGLSGVTITLGGTELQITEALTIDARPLAENVTINANLSSRIFHITATTGDFTLGGLTLTGGRTTAGSLGGAIRSITTGNLTLDRSTVSGNSSTVGGGGIFSYHGDVTLTHSTVSGNSTAGAFAFGGGVGAVGAGAVSLIQSTVSGNSAQGGGGGVFLLGDSGPPLSISGSILAGNTAGVGPADLFKVSNSTLTVNYSLIGTGITPTAGGNNVVTDHPQLGPLANSGGPTKTHAPLADNPAIDAGDPAAMAGVGDVPLYDQRGEPFSRVVDGDGDSVARIDIGAYERRRISLVVDTLADESDGNYSAGNLSLREAISLAFESVGAITFAPSLTSGGPASIVLTVGELPIVSDLTIHGPGANLLTIDGDASRIFRVDNGSGATGDVEIVGLTLTDGTAASGGAIFNTETLTLSASTLSGNSASTHGGGIYNSDGSLTVIGSTISGNEAFLGGGGIANFGGSVQVTDSTITGNSSLDLGLGAGGGIHTQFGFTTITDSTLSGNTSQHDGGGIFHDGGTLTVVNSTLSGNTASNQGGGIYSRFGQLAVRHSTITGNEAPALGGGGYNGGGIMRPGYDGFNTSLENTIIAGNLGPFGDDDLRGQFRFRFSLLGRQTPAASIMDDGGNLIGGFASAIDPLLGPLANNGGATMTHALLAGSPAIHAGDPAAVAGVSGVPAYDQRGFAFNRVVNGRIDMGAFEAGAVSADFDGDLDVDGFDFLGWQRGFGATGALATPANGNADGDSDVDGDDLAVWKAQFGSAALIAAAAPAASPGLEVSDSPSRLSPQAVDAAMAWQMAVEAPASRPLFRPRWLRGR